MVSDAVIQRICRQVVSVEKAMEVDKMSTSRECFARVRDDTSMLEETLKKIHSKDVDVRELAFRRLAAKYEIRLRSLLRQLRKAISQRSLEQACQFTREIHCCAAALILSSAPTAHANLIDQVKKGFGECLEVLPPQSHHDILYCRNIRYRLDSVSQIEVLARGEVYKFALGMCDAAISQISFVVNALKALPQGA